MIGTVLHVGMPFDTIDKCQCYRHAWTSGGRRVDCGVGKWVFTLKGFTLLRCHVDDVGVQLLRRRWCVPFPVRFLMIYMRLHETNNV